MKGLWALPAALVLVACSAGVPATTTGPEASSRTSAVASAPTQSSSATPARPSTTPSPKATKTPKPPDPISVQALINKKYDGRNLKLGRLLADQGAYQRYIVTYRGDGLTISGVMNVPDGKGPFPVLVLNHGYIDPDSYSPGQGMAREQDYLARQGYVVLHTDYRGHASSDNDKNVDYELRLPYAIDTINAVKAVKSSNLRFVDKDRVGWLGRSMGGGVTLERAGGPAGPRRCRGHLRIRELAGRGQLEAVLSTIGGSSEDQPTDGADVRTARRVAGILARGLAAAILRPGDRAAIGTPRHSRRHLSDPLVRSDGQGA